LILFFDFHEPLIKYNYYLFTTFKVNNLNKFKKFIFSYLFLNFCLNWFNWVKKESTW